MAKAKRIITLLRDGKDIEDELNSLEDLPSSIPEVDDDNEHIIDMGGYTYNALTNKYIVPLRTYGREYVCDKDQHQAMLNAYSNWKGNDRSVQEIARLYNMRPEWVREYFKIMRWTHDSSPITDEELLANDGKEAIRRVLDIKRTEVQQELQHEDWKQTQSDAEKWQLFEAGQLNPFTRVLSKFTPKTVKPLKLSIPKKKVVKNAYLIGLSDLHFGAKANADELVTGEDYNAGIIEEIIDNYALKVAEDVNDRNYTFSKCVVCVVGDVLHSLSGVTQKGTKLDTDVVREEQFELAFNCLNRFINRIHEIFGGLEIHSLKGNHAGISEYMLFFALKSFYRTTPTIKFHLYKERAAIFRVLNTAVLMDHGDSDFVQRAKIPTAVNAREAYIHKRFLQHPEKLTGVNSKIMIVGDLHHMEYLELNSCEFLMLSSPVCGDRYADHLALNSRPRQNCIIIDENGVKELLNFYFD